MSIRRVNLNLLPILRELLRTKNVTRAGERIGLSQSATSAALSRLRHVFDDELLVQVGREMQLTEKAKKLIKPLEETLSRFEDILTGEGFDPSASERTFVIATADYVTFVLMPGTVARLQQLAPRMTIQIIDISHSVLDELRLGTIDLLIGTSYGMPKDANLHSQVILGDQLVCVASAGNPKLAGDSLDMETFLSLPHATFRMSREVPLSAEQVLLDKLDIHPHQSIFVPNFTLLPFLVAETGCISLVHKKVAERFKDLVDIKILEPPFDVQNVKIYMYWGDAQHNDKAHKWFRELLLEQAQS